MSVGKTLLERADRPERVTLELLERWSAFVVERADVPRFVRGAFFAFLDPAERQALRSADVRAFFVDPTTALGVEERARTFGVRLALLEEPFMARDDAVGLDLEHRDAVAAARMTSRATAQPFAVALRDGRGDLVDDTMQSLDPIHAPPMLASTAMLRVAVIELPASWGEPDRALELVDRVLAAGPEADLVVLPEASLTGYVSPQIDFDLTRFAEPLDGPSARGLAALAKKHRMHLVGPLVLAEGGCRFNATAGFTPDGEALFVYKKRHPWIPEEWATPGADPHPVFRVGDLTVTVACCYDVHFLAREASDVLDAADLMLFPSAWVEERDSRLRRLSAIARAHRVAVAAANWGPGVLHVKGQGSSAILDVNGDIVARVEPGTLRADSRIAK